jgi:Fe-S cluster assembly protein SufD
LSEHAKGEFLGTLYIAKDAQKSCAEQSNRNLLLDDTATMRTRPQLEIYADDVQATHGATTGQLDENALFYMQQRGISRLTAKQMLIVAFLSEAIETIRDEEQKEKLLNTIDSIL